MVVEWAKREAEKANAIVNVDVSSLKLIKDDKGGIIKTLPAKDLTNEEFQREQRNPLVLESKGTLIDYMSLKSQNYALCIALRRLKKGDPDLQLEPEWVRKNWTSTRTLKFIGLISEAFGESEKNLESSQSPKLDKSS